MDQTGKNAHPLDHVLRECWTVVNARWGLNMGRKFSTCIISGAALLTISLVNTVQAAPLTEQQARLKAAEWVRGPMFAQDRSLRGPASNKSVAEVLSHIRESLLVVRGNTGYCGVIREPTWILIWDNPESADWNGGYPVMINARTGHVLDCRL